MTVDLITIGETMAVFDAADKASLSRVAEVRLDVAGAEATVAIGVRRLGHTAAVVTRVGDDQLGGRVLRVLRAEGVDTGAVTVEGGARTGVMVKEHFGLGLIRVRYYRDGSAASHLTPADLGDRVSAARVLHVTGITAAISATARETAMAAVDQAVAAGVTLSFDVNYRAALWTSAAEAAETLSWFARRADILFASEDEVPMVGGEPAARVQLVISRGGDGASVIHEGERVDLPAHPVSAKDTVGAGDALVAGYLSGVLDDLPLADRLRRGITTAAFTVSAASDWQNLPDRGDLAAVRLPDGTTVR